MTRPSDSTLVAWLLVNAKREVFPMIVERVDAHGNLYWLYDSNDGEPDARLRRDEREIPILNGRVRDSAILYWRKSNA